MGGISTCKPPRTCWGPPQPFQAPVAKHNPQIPMNLFATSGVMLSTRARRDVFSPAVGRRPVCCALPPIISSPPNRIGNILHKPSVSSPPNRIVNILHKPSVDAVDLRPLHKHTYYRHQPPRQTVLRWTIVVLMATRVILGNPRGTRLRTFVRSQRQLSSPGGGRGLCSPRRCRRGRNCTVDSQVDSG